jgi:APA family basic amino acid/polyamine antiporter
VQGAWAALLATSGRFDQLTDYVVFSSWVFYGLNGAGVIVLRRRRPDLRRPYRVPGYPFVPVLFVLLSTLLLVNTVVSATRDSLTGMAFMALAIPVYLVFYRSRRNT